jgi:hypothetical protein
MEMTTACRGTQRGLMHARERHLGWALKMAGCLPSEDRSGQKSYVCLWKSSACRLFLLVSLIASSSTVKMEAMCSSETSDALRTTRCYNPEDRTLYFELLITGLQYLKKILSVGVMLVHVTRRTCLKGVKIQSHGNGANFTRMWAKRACLLSFHSAVYVLRHILGGPCRRYYFGNFQTKHLLSVINSRPWMWAVRIQFFFFQITSWCRIFLGRSIFIQLAMKFPDCYGTQKLHTIFTKACHWIYYLVWRKLKEIIRFCGGWIYTGFSTE